MRSASYSLGVVASDRLAETLDRVVALSGGRIEAHAGVPDTPGWVAPDDLTGAGRAALSAALDRLAADLETSDRTVVASFFFKSYSHQVIGTALTAYIAEQRVPDIGTANVLVRTGERGSVAGVAFRRAAFAALEHDAAAAGEEVLVLPGLDALREHLLAQVTDHLTPVIDALRAVLPLGARTMWGLATDTYAGVAILLCKRLGQPGRSGVEIEALSRRTPYQRGSGVVHLEEGGHCDHFLQRAACCFAYRLAQYDHCATCPLLSSDAREARLRQLIRERA